jgi:hypothetical protein
MLLSITKIEQVENEGFILSSLDGIIYEMEVWKWK